MDRLVALFLLAIAVIATAIVASYTTVMATYWFELRHAGGTDAPEPSTAR